MAKISMSAAKVISLGFLCVSFLSISAAAFAAPDDDPVTKAWEAYQDAGVRLDRANEHVTAAKAAMNDPERRIKASVDRQKTADEAYKSLLDRYNEKRQELIQTFRQRDDLLKLPRALFKEIEELDERFKNLARAGTSAVNILEVNRARRAKRDELLRLREERRRQVDEVINPNLVRLRSELKDLEGQIERGAVVQFDPTDILGSWVRAAEILDKAKEEENSAEAAFRKAFDAYVAAVAKAGPPFLRKVTVTSDRPVDGTTTPYSFEWKPNDIEIRLYTEVLPTLEKSLKEIREARAKGRRNRLAAAHQMLRYTRRLNDAAEDYRFHLINRVLNTAFTDTFTTAVSIWFAGGVGGLAKARGGWRQGFRKTFEEIKQKKFKEVFAAFRRASKAEGESFGDVVGKALDLGDNSSYAQPYDDLVTNGPKTTRYVSGGNWLTSGEMWLNTGGGYGKDFSFWSPFSGQPDGLSVFQRHNQSAPKSSVTASSSTDQTSYWNQTGNELKQWLVGDVGVDSTVETIKLTLKNKKLTTPDPLDVLDPGSLAMSFVSGALKSEMEKIMGARIKESQERFWKNMEILRVLYGGYSLSLITDRANAKEEKLLVEEISKGKAIISGLARKYVSEGGYYYSKAIPASVRQLKIELEFSQPLIVAPALKTADETIRLQGSGTHWTAEWNPPIKTRARKDVTLEISLDSRNKPFAHLDKDPQTTPYLELGKKTSGNAEWKGYEHGPDRRHVLRFDGYDLSGTWKNGDTEFDCVHTLESHRFACRIVKIANRFTARGWRVGMVEYDLTIRGDRVSGKEGIAYKMDIQKKCPRYRGVRMLPVRNGKLDIEHLTISGWQWLDDTLTTPECKITDHKWLNDSPLVKEQSH